MSELNRNRLVLALLGLAALAVMTAIFCFSQQTGDKSYEVSQAVLNGIKEKGLDVLTPVIALGDDDGGESFHFRLEGRKWGHFYLFALLGAVEYFWWERLLKSRNDRLLGFKLRRQPAAMGLAFVFCLLYACADEFHQLFVNSREGRPGDLIYDSLGFGLSILAAFAVTRLVVFIVKKLRKVG